MKTFFTIAFLLFAVSASADVYVQGYTRDNGTYVPPHYRSDPNSSVMDNWSTQGNTNPHTGERGTVDPYSSSSPFSHTYKANGVWN